MNTQSRIYVTLSPRIRKALELCAKLDGSTPASYAAFVVSSALTQEIEASPALRERWHEMEREALLAGNWATSQDMQPGLKQPVTIPGWRLAGSHPEDYECGTEERSPGKKSATLKAKETWGSEGFGTLMQSFRANKYANKRLRYSAQVRAENVESWAGLWMRVDGSQKEVLAFDNMQDRPIKGTADWKSYEIVLDVAPESVNIAFGILLYGSGQIWISDIQFEAIEAEIPTTQRSWRNQPENLNFAEA